MDGTLGSQTALMLDGSGVEITTREELAEIVRRGARGGLPRGRARDRRPREPRRARRVRSHAGRRGSRSACAIASSTRSCLRPEDVPRFAELGVAASVQFSHAPSDRDLAERFWGDRLDGAYAFRSLLDSGAVLANGSDAPIEELDPLPASARASAERSTSARRGGRSRRVTVQQALEATCVAPAWLARDERRRGRLIPGQLADLVVLDRDPWRGSRRRGRRDDGRRPLGAQPAALGLEEPEPLRRRRSGRGGTCSPRRAHPVRRSSASARARRPRSPSATESRPPRRTSGAVRVARDHVRRDRRRSARCAGGLSRASRRGRRASAAVNCTTCPPRRAARRAAGRSCTSPFRSGCASSGTIPAARSSKSRCSRSSGQPWKGISTSSRLRFRRARSGAARRAAAAAPRAPARRRAAPRSRVAGRRDRSPHLREPLLHRLGARRPVVAHVRRRRDRLDPALLRQARQLDALLQAAHPVVEPREDVRVEIDQSVCEREEQLARARRSRASCARPASARSASGCSSRAATKPVMIVGIPLSASAGTIGSVPPERMSSGRAPSTRSNASRPSWIAFASGGTRPGRRRRPALDLERRRPRAPPRAGAARTRARSRPRPGPGASRIETFAAASTGSTVFCSCGEPLVDAVHVERRLGERPAGRTPRPRAESIGRAPWPASSSAPGGSFAQPASSSSVARRCPARSGSASRPSRASDAVERRDERVRGVQRGAAVHARVQVALAGAQLEVEVDEPARRDVERRQPALDHARVEDDGRVGAALVGLEELDDRVAAGLLLAVAAEADVDRQLAGRGELARGGEQHVELALVVDRRRGRRGSRRGSRARTASLTPTARAGPAAGRRSGRSRAPSAPRRAFAEARSSPIASGCPCQSTSSHFPPASRT